MLLPETVLRDLQYGARILVRNAGTTVVTVLALAIGIGVNTAVFTAYKAMVARPLDARAPAEMVNIALNRDSSGGDFSFSYPDYETYRDSVRAFSGLAAYAPSRVTLSKEAGAVSERNAAAASGLGKLGLLRSSVSDTEFVNVGVVSENYFQVLGVPALRGRTFESLSAAEIAANPPLRNSVVISENYWQARFAGDRAVLGKTVFLNGVAAVVIGIAPHDFVGTGITAPAFWLPCSIEPLIHADDQWLRNREHRTYRMYGRLASGVGIGQAQAQLAPVADHLRTLHYPRSESAKPAHVLVWPGSPFPLPLNQYRGLTFAIFLIMAAAGMVLLVACANVASLQLAKARSREDELRTRMALGASRLRLIRQLVTETGLMGVLAGIMALLFSWAFLKMAASAYAGAFPIEFGTLVFVVTPDLGIFTFVCTVSLLAGLLAGLAPAMESSRSALSNTSRGGTSSRRSRRLQDVLVAAQVALSLALMIVGCMAVRSSIRSVQVDTGYESKHALDLEFQFAEASKYPAARKLALVHELRTQLAALPGVAAITSARPPADTRFQTSVTLQNVQMMVTYTYVEANHFETLGIPLFLGPGFHPQGFQTQTGESGGSVVVSESTAKKLWPGENPVGRSVRLGPTDEAVHTPSELRVAGPSYQVAGVVRDTRGATFDGSDSTRVYLPLPADRLHNYPILIRTHSDPAQLIRAIEPVLSAIDPNMTATASTLVEQLRQAPPFLISVVIAAVASTVAFFGLLLAVMGIYSTVSYIVLLRTREVGIRMAIGARPRDVLALILRESARSVAAGLLAGIVLAVGVSYVMRGLFFGLNGVDGAAFGGVSLLFLGIALLASYPPASRAMRVDPMVALRYE
jgi:predicted permease